MTNDEMQERIHLVSELARSEQNLVNSELTMSDEEIRTRLNLVNSLLAAEKELAET
jgi:hypothetical protein